MKEYWIFPGNMKNFSIQDLISTNGYLIWKKQNGISCGDTVYIYIGSPYSQILYKCNVDQVGVDQETLEKNDYALINDLYPDSQKYIKLTPLYSFKVGSFPWKELKKNGLGQVQRNDVSPMSRTKFLDRPLRLDK